MQLETDRLIIRSIQQGDEVVFSDMAQDGSLGQVGFDANCLEWIGDWIVEALILTTNDNPRENYIPCTVILKETGEVIGSIGSTYYEDVDKVGIVYFLGTSFRQKRQKRKPKPKRPKHTVKNRKRNRKPKLKKKRMT